MVRCRVTVLAVRIEEVVEADGRWWDRGGRCLYWSDCLHQLGPLRSVANMVEVSVHHATCCAHETQVVRPLSSNAVNKYLQVGMTAPAIRDCFAIGSHPCWVDLPLLFDSEG